jgi:hypothetical protein
MKSQLIKPPMLDETTLTYPCIMEWYQGLGYQRSKELIVLFTDKTDGVVLHTVGSRRDVGEKCDSFDATQFRPLVGRLILENDEA